MFTNGHHHSSTHVALAIARHTGKIREAQREQRKWNISAGDCRTMSEPQTTLSIQRFLLLQAPHSEADKTHILISSIHCRARPPGRKLPLSEREKIDQKSAGVGLNFNFSQTRRCCRLNDWRADVGRRRFAASPSENAGNPSHWFGLQKFIRTLIKAELLQVSTTSQKVLLLLILLVLWLYRKLTSLI